MAVTFSTESEACGRGKAMRSDVRRNAFQEIAQSLPALPRSHEPLPMGDGLLYRSQRPRRQNGRGDDDAQGWPAG